MHTFDLRDRTAVITGGAQGFGFDIAKRFLQSGAKVIIWDNDESELIKASKKINNPKLSYNIVDISNFEKVDKIVNEIIKKNNIDILINNAAIAIPNVKNKVVKKNFEKIYNTNLISAAILTEACCRKMIKLKNKKSKSIINISSIYGLLSADYRVYQDGQAKSSFAYASSKAALNQLTRNMAIKYAKNNIRINTLTPGIFPNYKYQKKYPSFLKNIKIKIPLNRVGKPEEIITSILFLCSPYSSYITGTNIIVDGGYTIV